MGYCCEDNNRHHALQHNKNDNQEQNQQNNVNPPDEEDRRNDDDEPAIRRNISIVDDDDPQQGDNNIWARSEGYTPLWDYQEQQGSGVMMMAMMPPSAVETEEAEDEEEGGHHVVNTTSGVFFVDLKAFGPATSDMAGHVDYNNNDDNDDGNNEEGKVCHIMYGQNENNSTNRDWELPEDFRQIADRALLTLDDEYAQTLQGQQQSSGHMMSNMDDDSVNRSAVVKAVENNNNNPLAKSLLLDSAERVDENATTKRASSIMWPCPDNDDDDQHELETMIMECQMLPTKLLNHDHHHHTVIINTDAVRRAVEAIQLRDPKLVKAMSEWQEAILLTNQRPFLQSTPNDVTTTAATTNITTTTTIPIAFLSPSVPVRHAIIPKSPLEAFRKRTTKAIQATANLTRSATLTEGLYRILEWRQQQQQQQSSSSLSLCASLPPAVPNDSSKIIITSTFPSQLETLIVHIVGVDHVECSSVEQIQKTFGPWVRWMGASPSFAPRHIELHLIGPNIPSFIQTMSDEVSTTTVTTPSLRPILIDLMPTTTNLRRHGSVLESAVAMYHRESYHDWWHQTSLLSSSSIPNDNNVDKTNHHHHNIPHVVVCYNAGIWGYDEWKPTLQLLCKMPQSVPFIATAYSLAEAEDDWDTIRDVVMSFSSDGVAMEQDRCLWTVEANPFGSKVPRPTVTATPGTIYYENAAWQAWRLGGS